MGFLALEKGTGPVILIWKLLVIDGIQISAAKLIYNEVIQRSTKVLFLKELQILNDENIYK